MQAIKRQMFVEDGSEGGATEMRNVYKAPGLSADVKKDSLEMDFTVDVSSSM